MQNLQLTSLHPDFDFLQQSFGDANLKSIYGAGDIHNPDIMLIFMNPTGKNRASQSDWSGLQAPWIGTKNIWKLLFQTGIIDDSTFKQTQQLKSSEWSEQFALDLYNSIAEKKVYITNFAKCTQIDARPLNNKVFKSYRELLLKEIALVKPSKIITFGNQVSENLLQKKISVKDYQVGEYEEIEVSGQSFKVFPCYYPVGQGQRNMPLAVKRIGNVMKFE